MRVIFYSTHCPKCNVLKKKLEQKNVAYEEVNDVDVMTQKGFMQAPMLEVDDKVMNFSEATNWINTL